MLIGSTPKEEPATKTKEEFKELRDTKKSKNNRKRKGKQAPVKENIEVDLPVKPSTPKS